MTEFGGIGQAEVREGRGHSSQATANGQCGDTVQDKIVGFITLDVHSRCNKYV